MLPMPPAGSAKKQHVRAIALVNQVAKEEAAKQGLKNPGEKLKHFAPYSIRHTSLTNLPPECDTFALKAIAGHSSISITQRYVHPQTQAITKAFEKIGERQRVVIAGGHNQNETVVELNTENAAKVG